MCPPLLHRDFMICSSYRTLHFEILELKQIVRSNAYLKNLVDCCIKMYLHKVFIKCPNFCIVPKKELICVFPSLGRKSLEIKKQLQNDIERTSPYCKLKVIFRSPSKIVKHFHFKDMLPKKLCSGIIYSFKCNSCNAIYYGKTMPFLRQGSWEFHIWQTNVLKMLSDQLFHITCWLVTAT